MKLRLHLSQLTLLAIVIYLGAVPLLAPVPGAHDFARMWQLPVLLIGLSAFTIQSIGTSSAPWAAKRSTWMFVGLGSLALASAAQSTHTVFALQEIGLTVALLVLALRVAQEASTRGPAFFVNGLCAGVLIYTAVILSVYGAALSTGTPLDARALNLGYDNPRFLNHAQNIALPLVVSASLSAKSRRWVVALLVAAVVQLAWMFMDLARSSTLALVTATLVLAAFGGRRFAIRMGAVLVAGAILYALLFVLLPDLLVVSWNPTFAPAAEAGSDHSRLYLWQIARKMIETHPLLGSGPMHFAAVDNGKGAHPHNLYLQWAAEFGLPSTGLLLALLVAPVWAGLRRLRREPALQSSGAGVIAACLASLVDAGFSGNFVMPISQVWVAAAYGLLLAQLARPNPALAAQRSGPATRPRLLLICLVSLVLQGGLVVCWWQQGTRTAPKLSASTREVPADTKPRPRFWQNGWF
jgi:O-antigen ligase